MNTDKYPLLEVDLSKLKKNVTEVLARCNAQGIEVAGVIKGASGIPECAEQFAAAGCAYIASSRLEQLAAVRAWGIKTPLMLIRIPMISETEEVVRLSDVSLNSETEVLKLLHSHACEQNKKHKVILMADLGDLREGFYGEEELLDAALLVENELDALELAGIGTNLGCYGSIAATVDKMEELVARAEAIEAKIGRRLTYIGGGATTSFVRVLEGNMPERINLLRIGEAILLGKDLEDLWGYDMSFMHKDVFTLKAEVIEVKKKPSHPAGEVMFDAFGNKPVYEDRGIRKRALLALGKVDYGYPDKIFPREKGIEILGASSDHTILDCEDAEKELKVGDFITFDLCYPSLVFVTNSPNVKKTMRIPD